MAEASLSNFFTKNQSDRRRSDEKYSVAAVLYSSGLSLSEVASVVGGTRQSIYAGLVSRGIELRSRPRLAFQVFDGKKFTLRSHGYLARTDGDRELMHRYVWRFYNGDIPDGFDIHHKNHDRSDNQIENLECLSKSEHARLYNTGCNGVQHRCGKENV